jgi:hypothetical protein
VPELSAEIVPELRDEPQSEETIAEEIPTSAPESGAKLISSF